MADVSHPSGHEGQRHHGPAEHSHCHEDRPAGAADALLARTCADDIAGLSINGSELGEVGLEAALAGEAGVPLAFASGDEACAGEARELLGDDVEAVVVKRALTPTSAFCLPLSRTNRLLREAAARAMRKAPHVPPVVFQSPTTLEVVLRDPAGAEALAGHEGIERLDANRVAAKARDILSAYRSFALARAANGKA